MSEDRYYLGETCTPLNSDESRNGLIYRLRQYLELRNLTFLIGNGCSIPLGAPLINDVNKIRPELDQDGIRLTDGVAQAAAVAALSILVPSDTTLGVEPLLAAVTNLKGTAEILKRPQAIAGATVDVDGLDALERLLKKWLFLKCSALSKVPDAELRFHTELFRRILLRSTLLPRCKVFTLNYDLLIERALDSLGVLYFDGFLGTLERTLRSESYHYDIYYPGETTEGRVSRVDRVLQLYKMHGSINWRRRQGAALDVACVPAPQSEQEYGDVMIYPSPLKSTEAHGYPYSEMFRHFSAQIHQPQSALVTIGYSFLDDHVNRLIYQALSIPSFVLIAVLPSVPEPEPGSEATDRHEVWRLINDVRSKRILVITGGEREGGQYVRGSGTLQDFSTKWMPDIAELALEARAREETFNALKPGLPPATPPASGA